ncbi:hypothetical protein [Amycolatopsis sp. WGS_07]|uniref:hypothetical protein n=1 Tax=Amycolatopsis sp. WGS_07 TaxID=3076764 RepID=UPI0038738FBB
MVQQWAERMRANDVAIVTELDSASSALDMLERRRARTGVLVATYARAQHGPSSRALSELDFDLILHDSPPQPFTNEVEDLNFRARRAIALIGWERLASTTLQWPILWVMNPEQLVNDGFLPVDVPIESTAEELALRQEAVGVLREYAAEQGRSFILPSDSMPTLHARLLTLTSEAAGRTELVDRVWALLDRMESSGVADSRLSALDNALTMARRDGASCVVLAATPRDVTYIADYLDHTGRTPRAVLTGATRRADRRASWFGLEPGDCLVSTHASCEPMDDLPGNIAVILWPSSANRRALDGLFWTDEMASRIRVFELSEANPLDVPTR